MKKISNLKISAWCLGLAAAGVMTACNDDKIYTTDYTEAFPVTEITFNVSETLPLAIGMDSTLNYTVGPEIATNKEIIFSSSNPEVATVDQHGTIHAVALGTATISAVPPIGFGADAAVEVTVIPQVIKASEVVITNTTAPSEEGYFYESDELQLKCEILPADHTYDHVTWSSADETIATVDQNGLVTCLKEGDAVIRCHTHDHSGTFGTYNFHIYKLMEVERIEIAPVNEELCVTAGTYKLDVKYFPEGATVGSVNWESSDEMVATVRRGVLTLKGFGTTTITATAPNGSNTSIQITVASGWYIWDASNQWGNWSAGNVEKGDVNFHVPLPDPNGGKWRNDLKYPCSANAPLPMDWSNYPVLAIRVFNLATGGNNSLDAVDVLSGINSSNLKAQRVELSDGSALLIWDAAAKYNNAYTEMRILNLKIADIPNDRYSASDLANAYYDVRWFRTFKSADEAKAFADEEIANGK